MVDRPYDEDSDDAFGYNEDDSYAAALTEVAPKRGPARPAAQHRRQIERYWEMRRLKQQLQDDFSCADLDEVEEPKAVPGLE
jgi:hypothetical protein